MQLEEEEGTSDVRGYVCSLRQRGGRGTREGMYAGSKRGGGGGAAAGGKGGDGEWEE